MNAPLIKATLAAGERLRHAIEAEEFEHIAALAAARGVLVDRLLSETTPDAHTAADQEALTAQFELLSALLEAHEETVREGFTASVQQRKAQASYQSSTARRSILHTVHG